MKSFFTKITSFFLAVLILFSTSSFTVDMHFCCDKLVDMAFFSKAESCMETAHKKDIDSKECTSIQEKDCCNNQTIVKEGLDTFKKSNTILEPDTIVFLNTFIYSYTNLFEGFDKNTVSFHTYRSPLLFKNIIILNETFLI